MPRALATAMSAAATARICGTPPAAPSLASVEIVCTESTTSRPGCTSSTWVSSAPRSFSAARNRPGWTLPVRSARSRTWAVDSSPVTISARSPPRAAKRWATSSSSVDLPTPGSPASRTTEPGTSPPPSTRSSSATPVGRARAIVGIEFADRTGGPGDRAGATARRGAAPTSATVPQAWHSGQRPIQRRDRLPQSVHRKPGLRAALGLVTGATLAPGYDTAIRPRRRARRRNREACRAVVRDLDWHVERDAAGVGERERDRHRRAREQHLVHADEQHLVGVVDAERQRW